jgi:ATP-dependent DNA helicase DinG
MDDLVNRVTLAFEAGGALASAVPEYTPRRGQLEMARAVAMSLEDKSVLVVEAGTGVGKTYAYLVPALMSGRRVLLSTATKALQDQLFGRDIPAIQESLRLPLKVALLKGRGSYLCLHRLTAARDNGALQAPADLRLLRKVEIWATATKSGDVSEVPTLEESSHVLPVVTSTRENCAASQCPRYGDCFLYRARRQAMHADLIVINHHLFFADANVRESGVAELLPTVNAVIFDEAHRLNDIGVQFLGRQWTTGQLLSLGRDVVFVALQWARGLSNWQEIVEQLEMATVDLQSVIPEAGITAARLQWQGAVPVGVPADVWQRRLGRLDQSLQVLHAALQGVAPVHPELQALAERTQVLRSHLARAVVPAEDGVIRWLDNGTRLRVVESPMDISEAMQAHLCGAPGSISGMAWVFTSATLGPGGDFGWFVSSAGLQGAKTMRVESPFDYHQQAAFFVPKPFAAPSHPSHSAEVAALAARALQTLGGHTLILTTTLRAMRSIAEGLRRGLPKDFPVTILTQGESSKRDLLARYTGAGGKGCVLVASATFWEGIDIPGEALQLVIIDKIPFAPPDDPLLNARCQAVEAAGGSGFTSLQLPMAAVALKQGVGRLIRRESDRGVLVVCDSRLKEKAYGRSLMAALPPMKVLSSQGEFDAALSQLTKASTMDQSSLSSL